MPARGRSPPTLSCFWTSACAAFQRLGWRRPDQVARPSLGAIRRRRCCRAATCGASLHAAAWVTAVARQLHRTAGVPAVLAAIFVVLRRHASAGRVSAFLGISHKVNLRSQYTPLEESVGRGCGNLALELIRQVEFRMIRGGLSTPTRAVFIRQSTRRLISICSTLSRCGVSKASVGARWSRVSSWVTQMRRAHQRLSRLAFSS